MSAEKGPGQVLSGAYYFGSENWSPNVAFNKYFMGFPYFRAYHWLYYLNGTDLPDQHSERLRGKNYGIGAYPGH
jgi:hypothetical protein